MKHTPGPWNWVKDKNSLDFARLDPFVIMPCAETVGYSGGTIEWIEVSKADATLIKAAPNMLEALKSVNNYFNAVGMDDWVKFNNEILSSVRAAIIAATEEE